MKIEGLDQTGAGASGAASAVRAAGVFVQFGCGLTAPSSWLNYDASPRLRLERLPTAAAWMRAFGGARPLFAPEVRYGDIARGLPHQDASVDAVYCSHTLEHLASADIDRALAETFRILKPGAVFRAVVPDLNWRAAQYLAAAREGSADAADAFLRSTLLGEEARARSLPARVRELFGNSAHRWMFDFASLAARLARQGFVAIRRCEFGDADEPAFAAVEERARFFDGPHPELAVEARRP